VVVLCYCPYLLALWKTVFSALESTRLTNSNLYNTNLQWKNSNILLCLQEVWSLNKFHIIENDMPSKVFVITFGLLAPLISNSILNPTNILAIQNDFKLLTSIWLEHEITFIKSASKSTLDRYEKTQIYLGIGPSKYIPSKSN